MDLLGARRFPFLTRRSYLHEFQNLLPWSVLAGLVEGQFASVIVSKTFHGGPALIAVATATPFAAYVFSLIWGMLCVGRAKIRLAVMFGAGTVVCAGVIAAVPATPTGAMWFIAQVAAAQVLQAGVVTVRSAIWRANYPTAVRGQIVARLQAVRSIVTVITVQLAAAICDREPSAYRYIFPIAAVCGAIGVMMLPRLRIRGERAELRRTRRTADGDLREGMIEPYSLTALMSPGHTFGEMFRVLGKDWRFRQYCFAQTLQGIANLMTIPVVVAIVSRELQFADGRGFWISSGLVVALPILGLLGSIGRWGKLFDGLGVTRFRVVNVVGWTISILFGMFGTLMVVFAPQVGPASYPLAVMLLALRGILHGVSQGGGTIAWNLGHLHFARPEEAEVYMGIHVFLAGVRGLIAPLGGMWLWTTIGWWVWPIALAFVLSGLFFYTTLANHERAEAVGQRS